VLQRFGKCARQIVKYGGDVGHPSLGHSAAISGIAKDTYLIDINALNNELTGSYYSATSWPNDRPENPLTAVAPSNLYVMLHRKMLRRSMNLE
jgi:hypothetical protein